MTTTTLLGAEALIELHDRLEVMQEALADAVATVAAMIPATEAAKSRAGRTGISFWVDPDAHRQLRHLAFDTGQSVQAVMEEALDLWFREHGKARIASSPRRSRPAA